MTPRSSRYDDEIEITIKENSIEKGYKATILKVAKHCYESLISEGIIKKYCELKEDTVIIPCWGFEIVLKFTSNHGSGTFYLNDTAD
jgi:hypothetical protein